MANLKVLHGLPGREAVGLTRDVVLGRDPRCQVIISHPEVSAHHARIYQMGEHYYLEDLRSRNGTFVGTEAISRRLLRDGDELRIGRTIFRFDATPDEDRTQPPLDSTTQTFELDARRMPYGLVEGQGGAAGGDRLAQSLRVLCNLSRNMGTLTGLKATLDEFSRSLLQIFPSANRVIILISSDGSNLEPVVTSWRNEPETLSSHYSETIVRKALTEKRAVLICDALMDATYSASRSVMDLRLRSVMCAPILHRDQALGVVELDTTGTSQLFVEDDLELLMAAVAQVSFSVANAQMFEELQGIVGATVQSLTQALGLKSPLLLAHSERVSRLALSMARRLELPLEELETLRLASMLHDIGLLAAPDSLWKTAEPGTLVYGVNRGTGELDPAAKALIRSHPEKGAEILAPIRPLRQVTEIVLSHHERYDGRGYPRGTAGRDIPLAARILAVAEVFDAITAPNYYRVPRPPEEALEVMRGEAGLQLDPDLVKLFEEIWEARKRLEERRGRK